MKATVPGTGSRPSESEIFQNVSYWLYQYRELLEMGDDVPERQYLNTEVRTRLKVHYEQKKRGRTIIDSVMDPFKLVKQ